MEQEMLRNRLKTFLKETGTKSKFVACNCDEPIPEDILSRFKNGKRELLDYSVYSLEKFLESKGY